jgi:single-stranded DNA-binding protein
MRVPTGNDREGNALTSFVTVLAFGDDADRLAKLTRGDAISVQGPLKQTEYTAANGETRHGLEIMVNGILTAHDRRKKSGATDTAPKPAPGTGRNVTAAYDAWRGQDQRDFDDEIAF